MVLRELYASSHPRIHCVQEMQVSVKMTHNTELVQRLLSGVLKLGLHGHHGSGKGDAAQLQTIHGPINDSLRNSHTIRVNVPEHYLAKMTAVTYSHCCLALV